MRTRVMIATFAVSLLAAPGVSVAVPADQKKTAKAETKVKDPVCGMEIDPKTAEKSIYKGKTYYLCARSEKEAFDKAPEKYIGSSKKK